MVEGSSDIFLHVADVEHNVAPQVGDTLSFEVIETPRGPRAVAARIEHDAA